MSKGTRILIVEDLQTDAELDEREARRVLPDSQFLRVETREEFLAALESFAPDIILSDYKLPRFDGLSALKLALERVPDIPFIVVTGSSNEDTAVECMKSGAWDYVIKEHIKRLGPAIMSGLEQKRLRFERRISEQSLRDSEEKYRLLVENAHEGIYVVQHGIIKFVNKMALGLTGRTQSEVVGQSMSDFVLPEDRAEMSAHHQRLISGEIKESHREYRMVGRDGRFIWLFVNAVRIVWQDQPATLNFASDITDRKRAEDTLVRNLATEAAMKELLDLSVQDITTADFLNRALDLMLSLKWLAFENKGAIFLADKAAKTLSIQAQRGFPGPLLDLCSTIPFGRCLCGKAAAERTVQFAAQMDELHETRHKEMTPHGHYCVPILSGDTVLGVINLYVKAGHVRDQREEVFLQGVANLFANTIERKKAEMALRESESKFRTIIETTDTGFLVLDGQGRVLEANQEYVRISGHKELRDILGRCVTEWTAEHERQRNEEAVALCMRDGRIRDFVIDYVDASGRTTPVEINATISGEGDSRRIISLCRDITSRKQAETEMLSKNAILEAQINATIDGILIVDKEGNAILQNQRCVDLWKIPKDIVDSKDDKQQLEFVKHRTKDSDKFVEKVVYLYNHPDETSRDEVEFKDGTILDRYSAPVVGKDGTHFGRIWAFRDITAKKQSEERITRQLEELKRWQSVTLGREGRVAEMKREVNELLARLGEKPRYGEEADRK